MKLKPVDTTTVEYKYANALAEAELKAHEFGQQYVPFTLRAFLSNPTNHTCEKCKSPGCIFIDAANTKVWCRKHMWEHEKQLYEYNLETGRAVDWAAVCLGDLQRW